MKLYYSPGACSLIVRIVINELGLESSYEAVNLKTKKTANGHDYLTINPKGSVPLLELDDGLSLTENAIIIQYLADKEKALELLPGLHDFNRYRVLEWLNYIATDIHKGFGVLFNPAIPQILKDDVLIPVLKTKFNHINNHLQKHDYLNGSTFTLPDAYLFVMLRWALMFKLNLEQWPHIARYFQNLSERDSIKKSLTDEL